MGWIICITGKLTFDEFYRKYCETLLSLDKSIGEVLDYLEAEGLMQNTTVFYMGDNGFFLVNMG